MTAIKFLPWRGDHYEGGFQGRRVLVLGESHYHSEGEFINDDADITKKVVSLQFDGSGTTYRFFTHIAKTFLGPQTDLDQHAKSKFWHQVAFYNYVQESVGIGPRVRPTSEMWARGEAPFFEVLAELKPDVVIAFGYGLWDGLPGAGSPGPQIQHPRHPCMWVYPYEGGKAVLAYGVPHPAAGFSSTEWHPRVAAALKIAA